METLKFAVAAGILLCGIYLLDWWESKNDNLKWFVHAAVIFSAMVIDYRMLALAIVFYGLHFIDIMPNRTLKWVVGIAVSAVALFLYEIATD